MEIRQCDGLSIRSAADVRQVVGAIPDFTNDDTR